MSKKKSVVAEIVKNSVSPVKYVKRARQFCLTEFQNGKQTIHWFSKESKNLADAKYNELVSKLG